MASASIRIDQPLNPIPNGVPGISRDDIALGRPVIVRNGNANGVRSRRWKLDPAYGSTVSLSSTDGEAPSFTPDVPGTYLISLAVNAGGEGEVNKLAIIVKDPAGHRDPHTNEGAEANYQIAPGVFNKEGWSPAIRRKLAAFDNRGQAAIEITVAAGSFEEVDVTLPENMDEGVLQFIKVVAADSTDSSIAINTPAGSILTWLNFDPSTAARYYQNVSIMNDELGLVDHKFTMRVINDDAQSADYEIWMRIKAT
jgi:hypothetical protein